MNTVDRLVKLVEFRFKGDSIAFHGTGIEGMTLTGRNKKTE